MYVAGAVDRQRSLPACTDLSRSSLWTPFKGWLGLRRRVSRFEYEAFFTLLNDRHIGRRDGQDEAGHDRCEDRD